MNCWRVSDRRLFLLKHVLLGGVDPDDIQVAVIDALFILVGITGAALRSRLCLIQMQTRGSLGARRAAGVRALSSVDL